LALIFKVFILKLIILLNNKAGFFIPSTPHFFHNTSHITPPTILSKPLKITFPYLYTFNS